LVTVGFRNLTIYDDCDRPDSQAGDFQFNLGARRSDGTYVQAVTSAFDATGPAALTIGNCPRLADGSLNLDANLCRRDAGSSQIQIQGGSTLSLGERSATIGVSRSESVAIAGYVQEMDGVATVDIDFPGSHFPFFVDDPYEPTLKTSEGVTRTGVFKGEELTSGTLIVGTYEKRDVCKLDLQVFVSVK
jgi:hypothetical protein